MGTKTIHDFTPYSAIDPTDEILAWDLSAGATRRITWANALTNATLTTPTIASFVNATHDHSNAAGGGTLSGYLAATGATTGATTQRQTFTQGVISTGNVGVGTASPTPTTGSRKVLHVSDTTNDAEIRVTGSGADIRFFSTATTGGFGVIGAHPMSLQTNNTTRVTIAATGEVNVVGTTTIGGNAVAATATLEMRSASGSGSLLSVWRNSSNRWNITWSTADLLSFVDASTSATRMSLSLAGLMAVGSHTATALAHVGASTTSRASLRLDAGTRPTTPNTGDLWDDGAFTSYQINSTTNAVVNSLRLERGSSGTPAAGFGLGILAQLESSTTDSRDAGRITWAWSTATDASRAAIGKLTAYYTTTEREAITWVATSTGVNVGIGGITPSYTLDVGDRMQLRSGTGSAMILLSDSSSNLRGGVGLLNDTASATMGFYIGSAWRLIQDTNGNLGVNITAPQALIHGHDGSGGFMIVNRSGVGGTLVTVIPDGTGDVTENISFFGWVSNSAGVTFQVGDGYLAVSSSTTKSDGTNTLTIAVTAAGAFTLQATAGAATWKVCLWAFWR